MRYAVAVEYDGTQYSGWQRQPFFAQTIQQRVEEALSRVANHSIETVCAGRTDAGVHALQQVIHFDSDACRMPYAWLAGGNRYLPKDIFLQWVIPVADTFHARYSAQARCYRYLIRTRNQPSALWHQRCYWFRHALDIEAMRRGAAYLLGEHDFSAFRAAECQARTPNRFIERIDIGENQGWLWIDVKGNAFLHHMIRNIVGTLLQVGDGRRHPDWVQDVLMSRDRTKAGVTAPAHGLYFVDAHYDVQFALPRCELDASGLW